MNPIRFFTEEDVPPGGLHTELIGLLGYNSLAQAEAMILRDEGYSLEVAPTDGHQEQRVYDDGFVSRGLQELCQKSTMLLLSWPDLLEPTLLPRWLPHLQPGSAVVFPHSQALQEPPFPMPDAVDLLLLSPKMSGPALRQRHLDGWGAPAFCSIHQDSTGRARERLLALAQALGLLRGSMAELPPHLDAELGHFSNQLTNPLIFRALELSFLTMMENGIQPEIALIELHQAGEYGVLLQTAAKAGLYHSSPLPPESAGFLHHLSTAIGPASDVRLRIQQHLAQIGHPLASVPQEISSEIRELEHWRFHTPLPLQRPEAQAPEAPSHSTRAKIDA